MPELPEVETIRRRLIEDIEGKTIIKIDIFSSKNFIGDPQKVLNEKILGIQRKGKNLAIKLSNNLYLNIHLKLTGELLFASDKNNPVFENIIPFTKTRKMPANTTRTVIYFSNGSCLFFNDLRKFGWIKISDQPEQPKGTDILSKEFNPQFFNSSIAQSNKPIKILLMDQDKIAGIGNIYANDSLFLAKIHPLRKSKSLTASETDKLYQAIKKVIEQGIKHGGSSGADEAFVHPDGKRGDHQNYFQVYQRENQPCFRCKTLIKRIKQGGRSSFFCPKCQK